VKQTNCIHKVKDKKEFNTYEPKNIVWLQKEMLQKRKYKDV